MNLTPAQFSIMLALAHRDMHGYAIMKESGNAGVSLGPGTLYRSLKQLLAAGMIGEAGDRVSSDEDDLQPRRYYRLTDSGRSTSEAEANRLAQLVDRSRQQGFLAPRGSSHPRPGRTTCVASEPAS